MAICKECHKGNKNSATKCWNCGSSNLYIKQKVFDRDALYKKVMMTYINQGKSREEANSIAQKVVEEQDAIWKAKKMINF